MKLIKRNIRLMVIVICLLLVSLIAYGAYSLSYFGNRWFSSAANTSLRRVKQDVIPGSVLDRRGIEIAGTDLEGKRTYHPDPLTRSALVHLVGDRDNNVAYGVESFMSNLLYAFDDSYLNRLAAAISGQPRRGYDLRLTVDSVLTRTIAAAFPQNKSGAVIVMNYQTGELLALSSFPGFDPDLVPKNIEADPLQPFWNRATRWLSAPGSTFKVITLASAISNIPDAMNKKTSCTGGFQVDDVIITDAGMAAHGELDLKRALAVSCNITFAKLALELGDEKLRRTSQAFGFDDYLLFSDLVVENARYPDTNRVPKEIAWTGAGQSALLVTPLHMCMVAAAIGNDGAMVEPKILLQAADGSGRERMQIKPTVYKTPLSEMEANTIADAMRSAVTQGTAGASAVSGLRICGKTGSAEVAGLMETNAWYIGFIDDKNFPYAVCVAIADIGGGGQAAAPLAGRIFEYLKQNADQSDQSSSMR